MSNTENVRLVIEFLLVPLALLIWFLLRGLLRDQRALEKELAAFKLHASETFSTKPELGEALALLRRAVEAVFAKLERIEDKLDRKADKAHA